jgi:hypothetical protein
MYSGGAPAGENVVELIEKDLKEKGLYQSPFYLDYVGFEGATGLEFTINGDNTLKIPQCGYFITPYTTERHQRINSLVFDSGFSGDIYYII